MRTRYHRTIAGEWYPLDYNGGRGWMIRCCDCGLVHRVRFRKRNGRREFQALLEPRSTAAGRRSRSYRKKLRTLAERFSNKI